MESPEELKDRMDEAWTKYQESQERLLAAQHEVRTLYDEYNAAQRAYTAALQARSTALEVELERLRPGRSNPKDMERWIDPGPDFRLIVRNVTSEKSEERSPAREALRRMGPKAVDPLLAIVHVEDIKRTRKLLAVGALACAATALAILQMVLPQAFLWWPDGANWIVLLLLLFVGHFTRPTTMQKRAADALALIEDARVVGPLAEALEMDDRSIYRAAAYGLNRRLKKLRPADASLVTQAQMEILYRTLYGRDTELILSILTALGQIGDERALRHVGRLVDRPAVTPDEIRIQTAAQECQIMLVDRSLDVRAGGTLLRAAEAPGPPEESLLRPASTTPADDAEQLLRPTAADAG